MRTRTVRIYEHDLDRIQELAGLGEGASFATAVNLVVDQARRLGPVSAIELREILREELERCHR